MTKKPVLTIALLSLMTSSLAWSQTEAQLNAEAKSLIQAFSTALKSELQQAMQQGGTIQAIQVCNEQAPEIANAVSTNGWQVGRTSLKLRNRANQADDWEQQMLLAFEQRLDQGEAADSLSASLTTAQEFRFMKAIPTAGLCLACHGQNISSETQAELERYYPDDQATGFNLGDLRGAFTLSKTLDN